MGKKVMEKEGEKTCENCSWSTWMNPKDGDRYLSCVVFDDPYCPDPDDCCEEWSDF